MAGRRKRERKCRLSPTRKKEISTKWNESFKCMEKLTKKKLCLNKGKKQPLYELTNNMIEQIRRNNIHLTHFSRKLNTGKHNGIWETSYRVGRVGEYVQEEFIRQKAGNSLTRFDLSNVKKNYVTVTVEITNALRRDPNLMIIAKHRTNVGLLLLATKDKELNNDAVVSKETMDIFICNRYNIAAGSETSSHFGSSGRIYGFGLVAKYSREENCSFGDYAGKRGSSSGDKEENEATMHRITKNCMENAVAALERKIPYLAKCLFMISRCTQDQIVACRKLKRMKVNREYLQCYLSCQLNINATTRYSHTEKDSSYAIIHVPLQNECIGNYYFHFHISGSECLQVVLNKKVTIAYLSFLLTHSQRKSTGNKNGDFVNISSYFNERLHTNIAASMRRINDNPNAK